MLSAEPAGLGTDEPRRVRAQIAGRTKRECLYCKLKVPGHWAGRSNIFLSFLTLCWYLKFVRAPAASPLFVGRARDSGLTGGGAQAIFALWILFGLFFGHPCTRWNESATAAGLDTSQENGGCGTGGPGSALTAAQCSGGDATAGCASATCVAAHCDNDPSTIGELCWWALYLLACAALTPAPPLPRTTLLTGAAVSAASTSGCTRATGPSRSATSSGSCW